MMQNCEVRLIPPRATLPLRQKVLKPFLSESQCVNPGDDAATTFHQGCFLNNHLVGISTFLLESHPAFSAGNPYRLRGMATTQEFQGRGLGLILLQNGVELLRSRKCDLLWFNARETAFSFYEKLGFLYEGPLFDIKDIGPHKVMYKHIIPR